MKLLRSFGAAMRQNKSLLLFVFLLVIFRGAIADWHPVPTGSMKPTILEGDVVLQNKLAYDLKIPFTDIKLANLGEPARGDIVVINSTAANKRLIKRLIGMPGDEIALINNQLIINGLPAIYNTAVSEGLTPLRDSDKESVVYAWESFGSMPTHVVSVSHQSLQRSNRTLTPNSGNFRTIVPDGHYFFMGDNRDKSADSRYYGSIARDELRGKATHTLVSLNILDKYKPRFERFFARLN